MTVDRCQEQAQKDSKTCPRCSQELPLDDFGKNRSRKDGHEPLCKPCKRVYQSTEYYAAKTRARRNTPEGWASRIVSILKDRRRGDVTIDREWVLKRLEEVGYRCEQTGIPFEFTEDPAHANQPSVDRIDQTRGYDPDNCQLTCLWYNHAKNVRSDDEIHALMRLAVGNRAQMADSSGKI